MSQRYREMRQVLEPIVDAKGPDAPEPRDVLYYIGEATWHDGRHGESFAYFKRALELDRHFRPATVHAWQYLVARRSPESVRFVALADAPPTAADFALGRYEAIADELPATLVLGREPTAAQRAIIDRDDLDGATYRIALALAANDRARASQEFAAMWSAHVDGHELTTEAYYSLEMLGEVVIAGELRDESHRLASFLLAQGKPRSDRGYQRLGILAAAVTGDMSLILREDLSERYAELDAASEAELAGDRETAVKMLAELVANPSFSWDYPERAALIRNLRALKRKKEVAALCADTERPAIWRVAYLVVRARCKS
jgi:hypothetical protein